VKDELSVDCQEAYVFCPRSGFLLESPIQSESAVGVRLKTDWPHWTVGHNLPANGGLLLVGERAGLKLMTRAMRRRCIVGKMQLPPPLKAYTLGNPPCWSLICRRSLQVSWLRKGWARRIRLSPTAARYRTVPGSSGHRPDAALG
jgi:hypothetical protein